MKNYLIITNDSVTIDEEIKKILNDAKLTEENVIRYDLSETLLDNVIEELNTYGLFTDNKVVIASSCEFLTGSNKKNQLPQDEKLLEDYINNPNPLNILIIICDKLDERKKINKLLKEKCTVIESNLSIEDKIKKELEDYKMDFKTINYLIGYLNNDNQRIITELRKLKIYKYDEKVITIPDIDEIVLKEFDDNVFSLIDSIVKKNIKKSFEIYEELTSRGEDINKIVIMTTDQFRLIYKVKLLINEGKSKDMITSILKIHPYRVKLAMEASYNFTNMELIRYIKTLGQIDINTKMGVSPNNYGFDLFLLNL